MDPHHVDPDPDPLTMKVETKNNRLEVTRPLYRNKQWDLELHCKKTNFHGGKTGKRTNTLESNREIDSDLEDKKEARKGGHKYLCTELHFSSYTDNWKDRYLTDLNSS